MMRIELTIITDNDQCDLHGVQQELIHRRADILSIGGDLSRGTRNLIARAPLAELTSLSTAIRVISSGKASIRMVSDGYEMVSSHELHHIISRHRTGTND